MDQQTQRIGSLKAAFQNYNMSSGETHTDGCVILGGNTELEHKYVTRFHIDHALQRKKMSKHVMHEECIPCCDEENRTSARSCCWNFIKAEAFLFSLHVIALALGVIKEAINIREIGEDIELIHSLVETIVAMLMLIIRMVIAWYSYKEVQDTAFKCEVIINQKENLRGKTIKRWRNIILVSGSLLLASQVVCFILFYFLVHLGWTILSNNFAMIFSSVISGLYTTRTSKITSQIQQDQHKAVLYEAMLLLKESYHIKGSYQQQDFYQNVRRFTKAMAETDFLAKPEHITLSEHQAMQTDILTAMEMQSMTSAI